MFTHPNEANTELVVDADAPAPGPIARDMDSNATRY
jgi:hypothetical protein